MATPIELSKEAPLPASPINPPSSPTSSEASISIPGTPVFSFFPFVWPASSLIDVALPESGRVDKDTTPNTGSHLNGEDPSTSVGSPRSPAPYETEAASAPTTDAPQGQSAVPPTVDEDVDMEETIAESNVLADAFEIEEINGIDWITELIKERLEPKRTVKVRVCGSTFTLRKLGRLTYVF